MASFFTIKPKDFLNGTSRLLKQRKPGPCGKHSLVASEESGRIVVKDESGEVVEATFGGTSDNRTVYAEVAGVGVIGGWQYPHKKMPWLHLVESINKGNVYHDVGCLPRSSKPPKTCPHCGGVLRC